MSAQLHILIGTLALVLLHSLVDGVQRAWLAAVFVLLLCPLGWLLRALGVDLIGQRPCPKAKSYWRPGPDMQLPTKPQPSSTQSKASP